MAFPTLATVNATDDISNLFIYVNELTLGRAVPAVLFAFFVVIALSSVFMQIRFKGESNFKFSFASASFATFGLAVLFSLKSGLLNPIYLITTIGLVIVSAIWLFMSSSTD